MGAFARLRERRPAARLVLAGLDDPTQGDEAVGLPPGAVLAPVTTTEELADAYAGAAVSVLPSVHEAFGLVLVESLTAGTPAVAARSGACPEVLDDDRIGRLFEPDDEEDLARALDEALDLAADPATAARCREHAARWDWDRILPRYEELYEAAVSSAR
jgi:phosphatidylinositol alpha-mannosyltransferase